jgi:hypothetical protein
MTRLGFWVWKWTFQMLFAVQIAVFLKANLDKPAKRNT